MSLKPAVRRRLGAYAALAGVVLAGTPAAAARAQVAFTDVEPDSTLDAAAFEIDFDGDGRPDAAVAQTASFTTTGGAAFDAEVGFLSVATGRVVGDLLSIGVPGYGTYQVPYADVLSSGAPISSAGLASGTYSYGGLLGAVAPLGPITLTYGPWADPAGVADGFAGLRFTASSTGATHFGWVRLATGPDMQTVTVKSYAYERTPDTPLNGGDIPVELTAFEAATVGADVLLRWTTASETANAGFEVQLRRALDGGAATFEPVAFVEGAGTTTEAQSYGHRLPSLAPGRYAVRLRQVDFDGAFAYGPVREVEVTLGGTHTLAAYPNPVPAGTRPQATLRVATAQPVTVELFNTLGQRVAVLHDGPLAADRPHTLTAPRALPSGVYVLRARGAAFQASRRLTVVR